MRTPREPTLRRSSEWLHDSYRHASYLSQSRCTASGVEMLRVGEAEDAYAVYCGAELAAMKIKSALSQELERVLEDAGFRNPGRYVVVLRVGPGLVTAGPDYQKAVDARRLLKALEPNEPGGEAENRLVLLARGSGELYPLPCHPWVTHGPHPVGFVRQLAT